MTKTNRLLALGALLAGTCISAGCADSRAIAPAASPTPVAIDESAPLGPAAAAARAVSVSPRVHAAALRLDASAHRAQSADAPPDPSIALSLGVPIDGLGGSPVSISIMEGLAWLMQRDAIRDAAARERDRAAEDLLATTVAVAAEARRLVRTLDAAREATRALDAAASARATLLAIEREAADLRESMPVRVRIVEREAQDASARAIAARLAEHDAEVALASLLSVESIGAIARDDAARDAERLRDAPLTSLEVVRARARVARAEATLALAESPLGSDARAGVMASRDMEDRQAITGTIELSVPLFRRSHDLAALRADLAAERAELAEAERIVALETVHARAALDASLELAEVARKSWRSALHSREMLENTALEGELSRAALHAARAVEAESLAGAAERRMKLSDALAALESRAIEPSTASREATP